MLSLTHALAGAAIAKISASSKTAMIFALLSHPLLDYIPHWDLMTRNGKRTVNQVVIYSLIDAGIGFILGVLIFKNSVPLPTLLGAMFMAQIPDWLEAPYTVFNWRFPPFSWVKEFQHKIHHKAKFPDGLYIQLILIFFLLLISK